MTMLTSIDVSHVTFYPEILQVAKVPKSMKKVDAGSRSPEGDEKSRCRSLVLVLPKANKIGC